MTLAMAKFDWYFKIDSAVVSGKPALIIVANCRVKWTTSCRFTLCQRLSHNSQPGKTSILFRLTTNRPLVRKMLIAWVWLKASIWPLTFFLSLETAR